jgi:quinol monooxygenase YgiN
MQYVLIIHEVADYLAWKQVFDDAAVLRKAAGELSYQLLNFDDNKNNVVHLSRWTSLQSARQFFESPRVAEIRKQAGVKAPHFMYLNELEVGVL